MCLDVPQPNTLRLQQREALPKLEALSREMEVSQKKKKKKRNPRNRTDLEFQELEGFMELGFDFSHDKLSPRLLELLPGLKRFIQHENSPENRGFQELALDIWELPIPSATEVALKEHLKLWARSVASTLKC